MATASAASAAAQMPWWERRIELHQLVGADLDRIAAGAGIGFGHPRQLVQPLAVDAEAAEIVRDAEPFPQIHDPGKEALEAGVLEAEIAGGARKLVRDRRPIEGEHIGHEHGVGEAVMGVVDRTHGVTQRMDGAEAFLEGDGAHAGGGHHLAARDQIGAVGDRDRQVLLHQPHAFDGDAVGEGVVRGRAVGLEVVRKRIHAGRRGDALGQAHRQRRIGQHDARQHPRVKDDLLGVGRLVGDDRCTSDLGAGAGGRRHGDHRSDAVGVGARPPVADVFEVPERTGLSGHEGDGLARIERAAAAEGDDAVMPASAIAGKPILDIAADGVAADIGEQPRRHAGLLIGGDGRGDHRQLGEAGIGHQQWSLDADLAAGGRKLVDAADTEADRRRERPIAAHGFGR